MDKKVVKEIENYMSVNGLSDDDSIGYLIENILEKEKYVPFEEVVKALREGKYAVYVNGKERITIGMNGCMDWTSRFSWKKLIDGDWLILED